MATWLLQLVLVIAASNICGRLAERLGQCHVVGEIAAGLLLGPSALGVLAPGYYESLFGAHVPSAMTQVGEVGLVLVMFQVGLHLDVGQGRGWRGLRGPAAVALGGMCLPAAAGMAAAMASKPWLAPEAPALPYVLFCGVALAVSAVPVMARIVDDLRLSTHPAAGLAISAAMVTDALGWLLLAVIASLSTGPGLAFVRAAGGLLAYLAITAIAVRVMVRPVLARLARTPGGERYSLSVVLAFTLISAWATSVLGFHTAFGALAAGLFLRRMPGIAQQWHDHVEGFVRLVLMPVFFVNAGLHASLGTIEGTTAWFWFGVFFACGFVGKFGGSYLGARLIGCTPRDASLVGSLMNTRGLMELIVLSIGLQLHILPARVYTVLMIFALVTTALTAPLIRCALPGRSWRMPAISSVRK